MADAPKKKSWWKIALLLLVVLAGVGAAVGWYKFFREEPQPDWVTATPDMRFKYGSIGAENDAGIPYWIFFVLPRMFPEKLPGPGGYAALGVAWEQGQELPIGFTKKVIGFPRVANNCASCHVASYRKSATDNPVFVPTGPNHTLNLQAFFRFVVDCAKDPRFNRDEIMREIALVYDFDGFAKRDATLYPTEIMPALQWTLNGQTGKERKKQVVARQTSRLNLQILVYTGLMLNERVTC